MIRPTDRRTVNKKKRTQPKEPPKYVFKHTLNRPFHFGVSLIKSDVQSDAQVLVTSPTHNSSLTCGGPALQSYTAALR